jgi:hypothetical protein
MEDIFSNEWDNTNDDVTIEDVEIDDLPPDDLPEDTPSKVVDITPILPKKEEKKEDKPKEEKKLSPYEQIILAEMQRRATDDELLAKGLESADKSIQECFKYVYEQARKIKDGNVAMVEDSKVYGWAVHYYTEPKDVTDAELHPKPKTSPKTETKSKDKGKKATAPAKPNKNPILSVAKSKGKETKKGEPKTNVVSKKDKKGNVVDITEFLLF